jgi:RNA polymerase sigma factor (sigma-70 family)
MAHVAWNSILRHLRRLGPAGAGGDVSDASLLRQFAAGRDEGAFAALVDRHGPMVWGVCRRRLPHAADAEDAFQATFLVLVRKAGSIHRPETLGPWLHGVAYRVCARVRSAASRRRETELRFTDPPAGETLPDTDRWELRAVLDEEVNRLPERYRVPFVLCHLDGLTNEEAARRLGCPKGTVLSRLSRARDRLRKQLTRRGVGPTAAALAVAEPVGNAAVPAELTTSTARLAAAFAAGTARALTKSTTILLTEGVLSSMYFEKLKLTAAVVLALALIGTGGGVFSRRGEARVQPTPTPKSTAEPDRALAQKPPEKKEDAPAARERGEEIRETLSRVMRYDGIDDPKTTLQEALDMLATRYNLQFEINEAAFRALNKDDVLKTEIATPTPIPPMNTRLEHVLRRVLSRVGGVNATYVIRKDHIEVTTGAALGVELHLHDGVPPGNLIDEVLAQTANQPLVYANFQATPLSAALRTVAESCRENVVLDPAAEGKESSVTVTASLHNVRAETAVRTLAALADLEVVRLDNVLFVTKRDKADRLRETWVTQHKATGKEGKKSP